MPYYLVLLIASLFCASPILAANKKNSITTKTLSKNLSANKVNKKSGKKSKISQLKAQITTLNTSAEKLDSKIIIADYFLESDLDTKSCDDIIVGGCNFRDSLFNQEYFHKTTIHIFNNLILATQLYDSPINIRKKYAKIKNGRHIFTTINGNKMAVLVDEGVVKNTAILSGSLANEAKSEECFYADKLFAYTQLYNQQIEQQDFFFKTIYDSDLKQVITFKHQDKTFATIYDNNTNSWRNIDNLILCRKNREQNLRQKIFNSKQCLQKLSCLDPQKAMQNECLDVFYVDIEICSLQEDCQEELVVNSCLVR
jgi:hypothetical protein